MLTNFPKKGHQHINRYHIFWLQNQVGLLNIDGYYDCLLRLFDKGVEEGFINSSSRNIVISAKTAQELIQRMEVLIYIYTLLLYYSFHIKTTLFCTC